MVMGCSSSIMPLRDPSSALKLWQRAHWQLKVDAMRALLALSADDRSEFNSFVAANGSQEVKGCLDLYDSLVRAQADLLLCIRSGRPSCFKFDKSVWLKLKRTYESFNEKGTSPDFKLEEPDSESAWLGVWTGAAHFSEHVDKQTLK